jgi:hypothetical protein
MMRDALTSDSKMAALTVDNTGTWNWQTGTSSGGRREHDDRRQRHGAESLGKTRAQGRHDHGFEQHRLEQMDGTTVTMASNCYIGLSVASGSTSVPNSSTFDNVTVVP